MNPSLLASCLFFSQSCEGFIRPAPPEIKRLSMVSHVEPIPRVIRERRNPFIEQTLDQLDVAVPKEDPIGDNFDLPDAVAV